jgi:hypothetical protein
MHVCHECKDLRVERDAFRDRALAAERLLNALQWAIQDDATVGGLMVGIKDLHDIRLVAEAFAEQREKLVSQALTDFVNSSGHPESIKRFYPM